MANPRWGDKCTRRLLQCVRLPPRQKPSKGRPVYASAQTGRGLNRGHDPTLPRASGQKSGHLARTIWFKSFGLVGPALLAFGTEFLALLAVQPLGVGFLRAFEGGCGPRLLALLFARPLVLVLRGLLSWRRRLRESGARPQ